MASAPAIILNHVGMTFPGKAGVRALEGVTFDVADGEFVALVGPSGCGKSTLLRLVAGLLQPSEGAISVHGKTPLEAQKDVEFGFVFQDPVLFPWMSVLANVRMPGEILRERNPVPAKEQEQHARQLLSDVGLAGFERHYPEQLSGGMKQRVALARALSYQPTTLLMDEPFGALDEFTRDRLNLQLLEVWEKIGATALFVTHSIQEAVFLSDRVAVLSPRPGRVVRLERVPFPRPRQFDLRFEPRFIELVAELRHLLQTDGG
jgi:NitT/TauT family transport system ATP-binding protein